MSSWRTYAGAIVGGAASGALLAATGNVGLANAANGFVTTAVSKSLDKALGHTDMSWAEIGMNAVVDGAFSYALGGVIKANGVTKGAGNYAAVYRAGLTKLKNGTAKTISTNVVSKGIESTFVSGLAMDSYYGLMQLVD